MLKKIFSLILVITSVFTMVACSNNTATTTDEVEKTVEAEAPAEVENTEEDSEEISASTLYSALMDDISNAEYINIYMYYIKEDNSVDLSAADAVYCFSTTSYYYSKDGNAVHYDYQEEQNPGEHIRTNMVFEDVYDKITISNPLTLTVSKGSINGVTYTKVTDTSNNSNWYFNDDMVLEYIKRNDVVIRMEFNVKSDLL